MLPLQLLLKQAIGIRALQTKLAFTAGDEIYAATNSLVKRCTQLTR